ncbi:MAG: hypothetical protein HN742_13595 [Lentisphaerae bacterium]|jgi:hypothetical protein|nr:hypothetical protein [Lentisphaerota bacterium]MBT4822126.1 hypothetical protein [Lentisphaerota bacterium]MBT5608630.1 hypothetical protein [Lentisphaerota bacterium]MBT7057795.1 hypothetical protein [Lentisphaerota bacterium]MBT7842906.1 hypothetical protein [Lentisphaerota bacterium]
MPRQMSSCARLFVVPIAVLCILGAVPAHAQAPAGPEAEEAAIEAMLHRTAQAFGERNAEQIKASFVENFAGPFRIPKAAQSILERVTKHAKQISASYQMEPLDIVGNRAAGPVEIDLEMEFGGDNRRHDKAFMYMIFAKEDGQWLIWSMERLTTKWAVDDVTADGRMTWAEEGISFPIPPDWGVYPTDAAESRRSIMLISPDLKAFMGAAIVELPMALSTNAIVQNHRGIGGIFPGSAFVDTKAIKLAGRDGAATRMDLKLGKTLSRVESRLIIEGKALVAASLTVTPGTDVGAYRDAFAAFCSGLTFTPPPPKETDSQDKKVFNDSGVSFSAPEGWEIERFSEKMAKQRQWVFGATVKPKGKDSFALLGVRDLPSAGASLRDLRKGEMDQLRSVAESANVGEPTDLEIDGVKAISWTVSFKVGAERKRREIFLMRGKRLYFLVADAVPPSEFETLDKGVDALIKTIRFTD